MRSKAVQIFFYSIFRGCVGFQGIRRKPLYYIVVFIIPTFIIACFSIIGIFTPSDVQGIRGEKVCGSHHDLIERIR